MKDWKKDTITIPNMLSLFRLTLIPVYIVIYLNAANAAEHFIAAAILAVSCLTDMIDGQIARRFHMISTLGKILDPLADKLTQLSLTVCLSVKYPVLLAVLFLFLVKEIFQITAAVIMLQRGKALPGALFPGKLCTAFLFVSFIFLVLIPEPSFGTVCMIAFSDLFCLAYAFISYIFAFFGKNPKVEDFEY